MSRKISKSKNLPIFDLLVRAACDVLCKPDGLRIKQLPKYADH